MAGIKDYSTTQANNTDLNGISTAEGMLPSNLNNAIRALMKNTRDWYNDSQWVEYGDGSGAYTASYASATSFTIAGVDVTSFYHADRRIKVIAPTPGTIYGTISSSSFSTNTTVNVTWDSGNLSNEAITNIFVAALSKTNTSIPSGVIGSTQLADGSVTNAKLGADAVKRGLSVVHYSMELSEHYVGARYDTVFTQIPSSELKERKEDVKNKIQALKGNLLIKYFPPKGVSVKKLQQHIEKMITLDNKPDLIIVFPWNLSKEIVKKLDYVKMWNCKFLVAIPKIKFLK